MVGGVSDGDACKVGGISDGDKTVSARVAGKAASRITTAGMSGRLI
jgi:hypothetical protein